MLSYVLQEVSKHKDALKPAAPISKKPHGIIGRVGGWFSALNPLRRAANEDQDQAFSYEHDEQVMEVYDTPSSCQPAHNLTASQHIDFTQPDGELPLGAGQCD